MEIVRLTPYDRVVGEGRGHSGMSALIDLVAHKRKNARSDGSTMQDPREL